MYSSKPEFKIRMKKQVYIFVCSLFSAVYCFSQSSKVDSLLTFVKTEFVEEKQKEILDSIHYAKRIQRSLLPTEKYIEKKLKELSERSKEA